MQFDLTDEQRAVQDTARRFTAEAITPHAALWDEKCVFPRPTVKAAADLGFGAIYISAEQGGSGLGRLEAALIMEAMALRRPVLTTYVAGIPELVRDGEEGWLFPAGSVDELARALETFMATPTVELESMGEAAYWRVLARHDIDIEAAKLAKLFGESQP
jgi:alkylation response protein AidB-like acyl-CoA dehydrogenase